MWLRLRIYTTDDIWKLSQNCKGLWAIWENFHVSQVERQTLKLIARVLPIQILDYITLEEDKRANVNLQCDKITIKLPLNSKRYTYLYLLISQKSKSQTCEVHKGVAKKIITYFNIFPATFLSLLVYLHLSCRKCLWIGKELLISDGRRSAVWGESKTLHSHS